MTTDTPYLFAKLTPVDSKEKSQVFDRTKFSRGERICVAYPGEYELEVNENEECVQYCSAKSDCSQAETTFRLATSDKEPLHLKYFAQKLQGEFRF